MRILRPGGASEHDYGDNHEVMIQFVLANIYVYDNSIMMIMFSVVLTR